jgi:cell division protein FtsA
MGKKQEFIVGLDIGTTKICAIVGVPTATALDIIGIGTHPSHGLRKGVVVNIESTVQSIKRAVEEAEIISVCEITSFYTGIAGGHIKGFNSHGIVGVKSHEVSEGDMRRVIDAASAIAIVLAKSPWPARLGTSSSTGGSACSDTSPCALAARNAACSRSMTSLFIRSPS